MLKNAYFLEKDVKNRLSVGGSAPESPFAFGGWGLRSPPPDPRVVTPAYYYNFVKFISNTKFGLLPSKRTNFASSKFLQLFFISNSVVFVDKGRKNISWPRAQGTLATPLKTFQLH